MKLWGALACATVLAGQSLALDLPAASAFIEGEWTAYNGDVTWIFAPDGDWTQFAGGERYDFTYELEAMPANLFGLTLKDTGERYVIHTTPHGQSFKMFAEGSQKSATAYRLTFSPSAAPPQASE